MTTKDVRGIRNNNWLNIRKSKDTWQGKIDGDDKEFETFETPQHSIRAATIILRNYQKKHNKNTVAEMISRWAPPVENKTDKYIDYVAKRVGIDKTDHVKMFNKHQACTFMLAMAEMEVGKDALPDDAYCVIMAGYQMA